MSVITLVLILCFLGFIAWLVNYKAPIGATFKMIINIVLIIVAVILVLMAFGVWQEVRNIQVPKI